MTRRAVAMSARLVAASMRFGVVRPATWSMPCTPRMSVSTCSERNVASATGPASASEGVRTPPVRTTLRSSRWALCSRSATRGEFVTTVRLGTLSRAWATAYVVVPAEMAIDAPGEIRAAVTRAMADLCAGFISAFTWKPGSSALRPPTAVAPPWTFTTSPLAASASMSRRTVMSDTPRMSTSSDTRAPPLRSTSRRMASCRCRASTPFPLVARPGLLGILP